MTAHCFQFGTVQSTCIFKISFSFRVLLAITQNAQESRLNRVKDISSIIKKSDMSITVIYYAMSLTAQQYLYNKTFQLLIVEILIILCYLTPPSTRFQFFNGDRLVVGFTTTCTISAYHHHSCEFEPRSWRGVLDITLCDKVCQ